MIYCFIYNHLPLTLYLTPVYDIIVPLLCIMTNKLWLIQSGEEAAGKSIFVVIRALEKSTTQKQEEKEKEE